MTPLQHFCSIATKRQAYIFQTRYRIFSIHCIMKSNISLFLEVLRSWTEEPSSSTVQKMPHLSLTYSTLCLFLHLSPCDIKGLRPISESWFLDCILFRVWFKHSSSVFNIGLYYFHISSFTLQVKLLTHVTSMTNKCTQVFHNLVKQMQLQEIQPRMAASPKISSPRIKILLAVISAPMIVYFIHVPLAICSQT